MVRLDEPTMYEEVSILVILHHTAIATSIKKRLPESLSALSGSLSL
ncbi:hypothetical protein EIKCOROL_00996 [Eikenella corrodens ATCC 23834]|uniref:Uncharacterized protein n=1 Tax=Eikenella corrodens ATCC 23834 TaxID=546274 RepID=C0DUG4_EIKCO|nr:hypothetical protein EIKCOROL_00996 [Eikenella corrodens ATCC 23834]